MTGVCLLAAVLATNQEPLPTALSAVEQDPVWGEGGVERYVLPAVEIVGFQAVLNQIDRRYNFEKEEYKSDWESIKHNLHHNWIIDDDPFAMNQLLHPYSGSIYHGFARSAGLGYWEALLYDAAGSALWEVAGETGPPSLNDQITTSVAGSFFGEALFRIASLLLEGGGESPGFFRELGAFLISPPTGFNRLVFGDRFDGVFPSRDPSLFIRAGLGARRNSRLRDLGASDETGRDEAVADFSLEYGLPGKPGYTYTRPFDYFQIEAAATSSSHALPESVMTRAFLFGTDYEVGKDYRGIWGLYGTYEYMSPEIFSVSSTALALGTTGQCWIAERVAVQGTVLGGMGWTAVGTIADAQDDRDFLYGVSPQALVALRVIFSDLAMLDLAGREYYVGRIGDEPGASKENILRGQASLTVRVFGSHALGIQFVATVRNSNFFDVAGGLEEVGALSLFYTYLSDAKFGAVEWRPDRGP